MTPVIFRKFRNGDVIALLPDCPANPGNVLSYMHIGQHGEASYPHILNTTVLSEEGEYTPLLAELNSIGYDDLRVYSRIQRQWLESAWYGRNE